MHNTVFNVQLYFITYFASFFKAISYTALKLRFWDMYRTHIFVKQNFKSIYVMKFYLSACRYVCYMEGY
jgi:hypothetical protein